MLLQRGCDDPSPAQPADINTKFCWEMGDWRKYSELQLACQLPIKMCPERIQAIQIEILHTVSRWIHTEITRNKQEQPDLVS